MMVEDRAGRGPQALQARGLRHDGRAPAQTPGLLQVFSLFETSTPQLYLDIDRTKAQLLGINVADVFTALQIYLGSSYVNDFNLFGRTFRVTAQADAPYRLDAEGRAAICACAIRSGETVPLGSFTTVRDISGPVPRAALQSLSGRRARRRRRARLLARARRSRSWRSSRPRRCRTASATNGRRSPSSRSGPATPRSSPSCSAVVFVFLVLAAQFESLTLPLAVILIVPMCLVASIIGVILRGQDNNILTQVGFIVLIGLAAKNAILIVEFAKQLEDQGRDRFAAAVEAARLRLRPILMTSLAFIFGVVAAGLGDRRRRRAAPDARHRGVLRHDRRDGVRPDLHAGVLRGRPAGSRSGSARRRRTPAGRRIGQQPAELSATSERDVDHEIRHRPGGQRARRTMPLLRGAGRYVADHAPAGHRCMPWCCARRTRMRAFASPMSAKRARHAGRARWS